MDPTAETFFLPLYETQHTEQKQKFQVFINTLTSDFLLLDVTAYYLGLTIPPSQRVSIPTRFQVAELTNTLWEHFKSTPEHPMTYEVLGLGIDLDNLKHKYVLYSPRYQSGFELMKKQGVTCLARPEQMFFGEVERDGYKGRRFRPI